MLANVDIITPLYITFKNLHSFPSNRPIKITRQIPIDLIIVKHTNKIIKKKSKYKNQRLNILFPCVLVVLFICCYSNSNYLSIEPNIFYPHLVSFQREKRDNIDSNWTLITLLNMVYTGTSDINWKKSLM